MQLHDTTPTKVCTKCGESKPATTEYFHSSSDGKYGLRGRCKACIAANIHVYQPSASGEQEFKTCTKCGESKPATLEYFFRSSANQDGLNTRCKTCHSEKAHKWYEANAEKKIGQTRAYYAANKERALAKQREYSVKNKARIAARRREYATRNAERISEHRRQFRMQHKELLSERNRVYRAANKERLAVTARARLHIRRARIFQADGEYTGADIQAQYERQKGRCYYAACGHSKLGDKYHVDHVVPLARGGTNWPDNIVLACPACNLSKHNRLPHEWPEGGRLL